MNIAERTSLDHFVVLVKKNEDEFKKIAGKMENAGFPVSFGSGKSNEFFETLSVFIGREYFEFLNIKKNPAVNLNETLNRWDSEGKTGLACIFLRVKNVLAVHHELKKSGVYTEEPYRGYYGEGRGRKSAPWMFLDLPPFESLKLQLRFIQLDPMVENISVGGFHPNSSKVNGVGEISKISVHGPLSDHDIRLLSNVFSGFSAETGELALKHGAIVFKKAPEAFYEFLCPTDMNAYAGSDAEFYNTRLKVRKRND